MLDDRGPMPSRNEVVDRSGSIALEVDAATAGQHDGRLGELVERVLAALDVDVGAQALEQRDRQILVELDDEVDGAQRRPAPRRVASNGTHGPRAPLDRATDASELQRTIR